MSSPAEPVAALVEVGPDTAVVRLSRWAPGSVADTIKASGGRWHRTRGPVPKCWTIAPAAAGSLAVALARAGAQVTVTAPAWLALAAGPDSAAALLARVNAIPTGWEHAARYWQEAGESLRPVELMRDRGTGSPCAGLPSAASPADCA